MYGIGCSTLFFWRRTEEADDGALCFDQAKQDEK
jgi:hypothetical protein